MSLYYNLLNMINKNDHIVFKKNYPTYSNSIEFEFMSEHSFKLFKKGEEAVVIAKLFETVEVKMISGVYITIPIDNSLYQVEPCIKSLNILQEYFEDQGDYNKTDIVVQEIVLKFLEEGLKQYYEQLQYFNIDRDDLNNDLYYRKNHLIKLAEKTKGTSCEKRGMEILKLI